MASLGTPMIIFKSSFQGIVGYKSSKRFFKVFVRLDSLGLVITAWLMRKAMSKSWGKWL